MTEAKWKLMVDWSGDGQFAGTDDDITSATLGLSLSHMRDLKTEYMDAGRLDIRLANSDHKYSPPNAASPLSGNLKPGRKVWLRAAFPCDEFDDAPGTVLADHAPEYGETYRWTTANQDFRIASGGAGTNGTRAGRRIATMDFGLADASIGCDFTRGSNANRHGGLTLRYVDADNFLYLRVTGAALELRKVEQGSDTLLTLAALRWDAGDRRFFQVEMHGDSIRVFVDRQQMITATLRIQHFRHTARPLLRRSRRPLLAEVRRLDIALLRRPAQHRPATQRAAVPPARLRRDASPRECNSVHLRDILFPAGVERHPWRHSRLCRRQFEPSNAGLRHGPCSAAMESGTLGCAGAGRDTSPAGRRGRLHLCGRARTLALGEPQPPRGRAAHVSQGSAAFPQRRIGCVYLRA